jgi:hypothetical protein
MIDPNEAYALYRAVNDVIKGQDGALAVHALTECLCDVYGGAFPRTTKAEFADHVLAHLQHGMDFRDNLRGRQPAESAAGS